MAKLEFNGSNIWHWLAVILVACLVAYVIYWLLFTTKLGLNIDKFQNTPPTIQAPVIYGFNNDTFRWLNYYIDSTLITSYLISTNKGRQNINNSSDYNSKEKNGFIKDGYLQKCMKYNDIFKLIDRYTWNGAPTDPLVVSVESSGTGFTTYRPKEIISTNTNLKFAALGDFVIPGYTSFSNLRNEDKARDFAKYRSYAKFNVNYLIESSKVETIWDDRGTGGTDNCLGGIVEFSGILAANKTYNFTDTSSFENINSPNRNTVYKLDLKKLKALSEIKFQGSTFPQLNTKPTQPCEVNIRVSNNATDDVKYIVISPGIDLKKQTYNLTFDSDKSKASKFYIVNSSDNKTVIILTRINTALPASQYDYVMGVDAINCDSGNTKHAEFSNIRMYPLAINLDTTLTAAQTIKPKKLMNIVKGIDDTVTLNNSFNQNMLYHNLEYPFYQFDLAANNTMSLDSIAGDTLIKDSQKFLFTGTDLRFCSNTGTNPVFAFDLVNELPNVTDDTTDSNIGPLFTVDVTIGNIKASSSTVYLRDIPDNKVKVTYFMLIVYAPTDTANNGKYLDITKSADGKSYTFPVTNQPVYFTLSEDRKQILSKLTKDSKGCVQITTFAPDKFELMAYVDPITASDYSMELFKDRTFKFRPVGLVDTYMYLNSDSPPKLVYAKPIPGTKPVGESGSPKITVYGTQTGNPDNVVLYIPPTSSQTSIRYIYYMSSLGSSQALTVLNTTTQFADLNTQNPNPSPGPLRQFFANPGRFRLIPKEGSQPLVYSVSVYMANGEYMPLQDIELADVTPPETTTTTATTTTTMPETTTTTTTAATTIPLVTASNNKKNNEKANNTKADNTKANNDYVPSSTPAPTEQPTITEAETTTTTTTEYTEIAPLDARIGSSGGVN